MAPVSQEQQTRLDREQLPLQDDAVVISGMSGLFPSSENIKEFSHILYSKTNPVNRDNMRWTWKHPQASEYTGKIQGLNRFDSQFFMVHKHLGDAMDPMARKLLEQSYQAIYDAGLNPKQLDGKKVGVYMAAALAESESFAYFVDRKDKSCYGMTGASKSMFANRVSYWLNSKGPSLTIDNACCGSMVAIEEAYRAINSGAIEAAIVGGVNICLNPYSQVHFKRCYKVSPDEKTKSFDQNAEGCTKSDAISILFLQKAKDAARVYAEVVYAKNSFIATSNQENSQNIGFVRDPNVSVEFLKTFYKEAHVPPQCVEYVEAFGSATPEADKAELKSIEKVFCDNRFEPLLVGSVISNIGFTDAASGATAITKVLLGYHQRVMASNLHCETPRQDIQAIQDGRMCVLTDHRPFHGTYAAINCLSFTGIHSHVLLRGYFKPRDSTKYTTSMPRLVMVSARVHDHITDMFNDLKSRPLDAEELALIQNIHSYNVSGHLGRGYIILETDKTQNTVSLSEHIEHFDKARRPLWFVYSGMGSQWAGMGTQLMRIPIFAAAIERCCKILEPKGIDLMHIITTKDKSIFNNVLYAFVGIAAIQIGITDILTAVGLRPDNIIGHSVGELGCAYVDGCLTAEEMILSAESRGRASNNITLIQGAMAAIGLGYRELSEICPPEIDIACHNSSTSSTISGPEESIRDFVTTLTAKGIFAKEVPSANIAYHSRYIANAGPYLLQMLSGVIKEPKRRSERWLSTSVPQERWTEPAAKYCSAEYLTNNLLSPVLFEETSSLIPRDAVLIEIAPHGLLQAILKRALPDSCTNIPLTQRGHADNALFLLNAIGKLYIEGYNPQVQAIYPKVEFPVSSGTPHLAHHVKWLHSEQWTVREEGDVDLKLSASCKFLISIHDQEHRYLTGNIIQGKILFPFAGSLVAVWDTLAMTLGFSKKEISVEFHDVHLYSQPILHNQKQLNLYVSIHKGSGYFEVSEGISKVASGYVVMLLKSSLGPDVNSNNQSNIDSREVYEHFSSQGYSYGENFRSIASVNESVTSAQVVWNDNWVTFIDGLLQLNTLKYSHKGISQPSYILNLTIDVKKHVDIYMQKSKNLKALVCVELNEILKTTRCGGVKLSHLKFRNLPLISQQNFKLVTPTSVTGYGDFEPKNNLTRDKKFVLKIGEIGDLESLHWEETSDKTKQGVQVLAEYAGINLSDVKKATGVIDYTESALYFGMDFSGFTECGSRVMGVVRSGAASTVVSAPALLWPVPAWWTLEDAATVPLAYCQAFYYLCIKSQLRRGSTVLIHGGAGAAGQAAISLALAHDCRVFTTVSNTAKKAFLLKLFPDLNENAIGNSRDHTFGDMVMNATNPKGCDIVISCVRNDLKDVSLKCVKNDGCSIDIVQIQNTDKFNFGMFALTGARTYVMADFGSVLDSENPSILKKLHCLVSEGISQGYVRPLSHVTFASGEAARAFRLLAASRHRGRALLRLRDSPAPPATPRFVCSRDRTQLIVWDGSPFGLQLADRLISRGARKIRICCLNSASQQLLKLRLWKDIGTDVKILQSPSSDSNNISKIITDILLQESIEGIYVSVTHLKTGQEENVTKVLENLDSISRKIQPLPKYFAVISGGSKVGQEICLSRSKNGIAATKLDFPTLQSGLDELKERDEFAWHQSALDILEISLDKKCPAQCAFEQPLEKPSLRNIIPSLYKNSNDKITLQDLDLNEHVPRVQFFLKKYYQISLDDNQVMMLTKKEIMELEKNGTEYEFESVKGLQTFFSTKDIDEVRATSDLIPMKTLTYRTEPIEGAINTNHAHLFVVPGLEGLHLRFLALCERLKLPALVLQPGLDRPRETPRELAARFAKILMEEHKLSTHFYLLGYEFGIVVAIELAAILEDNGLTGTVYCVGDGPDEMRALLESELGSFDSEASLQDGICKHIYSLMTDDSVTDLERALHNCMSWQERVEVCVRSLMGRVPHTMQYIRSLLQTWYARVGTALCWELAPRQLHSRVVLLRAHCDNKSRDLSCSLQRYFRQEVIVVDLAAPMAHASADLHVPAIVNQYLHRDLLHQYENSNICNAYLIN